MIRIPGELTPDQLAKPRIRVGQPGWWLEVPDQGDAYCTMEWFPTFEAALKGMADWWAHGNYASFLRHPGSGRDRRREVVERVAEGRGLPPVAAPWRVP